MKKILRFIGAPIVALFISLLLLWLYDFILPLPYRMNWVGIILYGVFGVGIITWLASFLEIGLNLLNMYVINGNRYVAILPLLIYIAAGGYAVYHTTFVIYQLYDSYNIDYGVKEVIATLINLGVIYPIFKLLVITSFQKIKDCSDNALNDNKKEFSFGDCIMIVLIVLFLICGGFAIANAIQ